MTINTYYIHFEMVISKKNEFKGHKWSSMLLAPPSWEWNVILNLLFHFYNKVLKMK